MKTTISNKEVSQTIQAKAQKQASVNTILQAYKDKTAQRQSAKEEELLQGKFETVQKMGLDEEEPLQGKFETTQLATEDEEEPLQRKPNNTGLPDNLKSGIENLSGYSMDDVKVHYNSSQPATLQAHAYAQGTDIHIAPGQEKHLPHEAWHVVQQKQGRVKPTMQMKGNVNVNDDAGLEKEADVMGAKVMQNRTLFQKSRPTTITPTDHPTWFQRRVIQRGSDPIDESKGISFKYGLIKGTYVPANNTADMHVENKTKETKFSPKDVYLAFSFVYEKMSKQKTEGQLTWNPQGAAVIKMVVELLGESLGNAELIQAARTLKDSRKERQQVKRDENILSQDIIPEHLHYLYSIKGVDGVEMKAVIPKSTEKNFDSDMIKDTEIGESRVKDYEGALKSQIPVSLRITVSQTQLGKLLKKMKEMK